MRLISHPDLVSSTLAITGIWYVWVDGLKFGSLKEDIDMVEIGMIEVTYITLHIPTMKKVKTTRGFLSISQFWEEMDNWNRIGGSLWKYWRVVE